MKKILMMIIILLSNVICYGQLLNKYEDIYDEDNNYIFLTEYYNWDNQNINVWDYKDIPMTFNLNFKDMVFPLKKTYVTSNYGYRKTFRRNHKGIDLKAHVGDTIYASFPGRVRISRFNRGGYGNFIVLRHTYCIETLYAHCSKLLVDRNDFVKAGEPIALSGNTGRSTGPHLHFEIRFMGVAINPAHIADFNNNELITQNYLFKKHNYF